MYIYGNCYQSGSTNPAAKLPEPGQPGIIFILAECPALSGIDLRRHPGEG